MVKKMATSKAFPLSNHPLYEGDDVDDAREVLSRLFTEGVMLSAGRQCEIAIRQATATLH